MTLKNVRRGGLKKATTENTRNAKNVPASIKVGVVTNVLATHWVEMKPPSRQSMTSTHSLSVYITSPKG